LAQGRAVRLCQPRPPLARRMHELGESVSSLLGAHTNFSHAVD